MIELSKSRLTFRFPDVHKNAVCHIEFKRTLRIPDDNHAYPLPPGFDNFPMAHVEDHAERLGVDTLKRGGVMLPMYQSEALWINFVKSGADVPYPFAIKIAAGKINAVNGELWLDEIVADPQDYVIIPDQPWLDGYCVSEEFIRQFVAMPLGEGYTAEEQIMGEAEFGGLQILAYPLKAELYEKFVDEYKKEQDDMILYSRMAASEDLACVMDEAASSMGFAPGGLMTQKIHKDTYGIDAWDTDNGSRCFVHIFNSGQWQSITGAAPPTKPRKAKEYEAAGLPWFEHYSDAKALSGSSKLAGLDSLAAKAIKKGRGLLFGNESFNPKVVKTVGDKQQGVSEGDWK